MMESRQTVPKVTFAFNSDFNTDLQKTEGTKDILTPRGESMLTKGWFPELLVEPWL